MMNKKLVGAVVGIVLSLAAVGATALSCVGANAEQLMYDVAEIRVDGDIVASSAEFGDAAVVTGDYDGGVWLRLSSDEYAEVTFGRGTP
jgi:hypothetical protein